jgi:hypothetical protein
MDDEKSVLRWGGLAGMLGGIAFILVMVTLIVLVQPPTDPEEVVMRFPDSRAAIAVGQGLYLVAVIMWVTLFLALYRALRETSLAPALFGSVLALVGLVLLAAGGLTNVAFVSISDLYHAPGATPEEQATLVFMWQAIQGVFNETDTVGILLMNIGFIILGVAMLRAPAFGRGFGWVSVVLGVVGIVGILLFPIDSLLYAPFGILAYIIYPVLFGRKVYSLSRAP